jgi:hypothetical protein
MITLPRTPPSQSHKGLSGVVRVSGVPHWAGLDRPARQQTDTAPRRAPKSWLIRVRLLVPAPPAMTAHVFHYPPPPRAHRFVLGPALTKIIQLCDLSSPTPPTTPLTRRPGRLSFNKDHPIMRPIITHSANYAFDPAPWETFFSTTLGCTAIFKFYFPTGPPEDRGALDCRWNVNRDGRRYVAQTLELPCLG